MLPRTSSGSKERRQHKRGRLNPMRVAVVVVALLVLVPLLTFQLDLIRVLSRPFVFSHEGKCSSLVNEGQWRRIPPDSCPADLPASAAACDGRGYIWDWADPAVQCGASRLDAAAARSLLGGKEVVMMGDSITRLMYGALVRMLGMDGNDAPVVVGHQDFEYDLPGEVHATFHWAPYPENVTQLLSQWDQANRREPLSVVIGVGLWHALHLHDDAEWEELVDGLHMAAQDFQRLYTDVRLFIVSVTCPVPRRVKTWQKWWHMTPARAARYNRALQQHGLLVPQGGPFHLLDAYPMTRSCGAACTHDGVHFINATYDVLVQNWANVLRLALGGQ